MSVFLIKVPHLSVHTRPLYRWKSGFSFCIHPNKTTHWEMQTLTLELSLSADSGIDESNATWVRKWGGKKPKTAKLFICWQSQQESSEHQCYVSHTCPAGSVMLGCSLKVPVHLKWSFVDPRKTSKTLSDQTFLMSEFPKLFWKQMKGRKRFLHNSGDNVSRYDYLFPIAEDQLLANILW